MKDYAIIKKRYLQDPLPVRLGGLAANLARVKSFSNHPKHSNVVNDLMQESKFFIEWTTKEARLDQQVVLVEMQLQLALWQRKWNETWSDPEKRTALANMADSWAKRILAISGLLQ